MTRLTDHDLEQLSAYLDGELKPSDAAEIEARLQAEPELERTLSQLRWMSDTLKDLPTLRAPRSYRLTPEMVGQRARPWRLPALRLATAVMALALVAVIGLDFLGSVGRMSLAGAPRALEAPASAQDSVQSEQAMTEKAEADTQPSVGAQAGAAEGTPLVNALRAAGLTPVPESSSPSGTPPMAMAVPQAGSTELPPNVTPTPLPAEPVESGEIRPALDETATRVTIFRWSEVLLGAGLLLLLAVQIKNRR
jgi:anti-sigma factor RsiW